MHYLEMTSFIRIMVSVLLKVLLKCAKKMAAQEGTMENTLNVSLCRISLGIKTLAVMHNFCLQNLRHVEKLLDKALEQ